MANNKVTIDVEARFIDNLTDKANKANKAVDDLGKKKPKVVVDADANKANQKINQTGTALDKLGKKNPKPTIGADDQASKKVSRVQQALKKLEKAYNIAVKLKDGGSAVLNGLAKMDSKINSLTKKTFSVAMKIKDGFTSPLTKLKNQLFSIKTLVSAIAAGFAINKTVLQPISLADQYSSAKIGFSTLLGQEQGQKMMDDLDQFAKATPFTTSGVIAASQKMIAMGWDAENIIDDMKTIGDAAAATGKGTEGLDRITLALSQIKSKGKLSTEELNQLAEAGISAKRYIAEGLGYGSGDEGIAKLSKALQGGAIGSEAAIKAILEGMKEYDGMMETTANETVEGLKSQLEDTFEINIARRWGQGLQDGAKKGLGSILELLDSAEDGLEKFGDMLYDLGREASNYFAEVLENTVGRVQEIMNTDEFQNADLMGKIGMLWEGAIANPFSEWWSNTVVPWWDKTATPWLVSKAESMGKTIGTGLTAGLLTLLGIDPTGVVGDGVSIGASFAKGFAEGFDGSAITDALVQAVKNVWSALPTWAKALVGGKAALSAASGITTLAGGISTLAGAGSAVLGSAAAGTGLLGNGALAAIGMGAGNLAGGASLGAGALSAIGLGGIAGGAIGAGTAISGVVDMYKGIKEGDESKAQRGTVKATSVGAGAALGATIGSVVPVVGTLAGGLIGAGVGGIAGLLGSNYMKKREAEEAKTLSDLQEASDAGNDEAAKKLEARLEAVNKAYKESFGNIRMSADEIKSVVTTTLSRGTEEMEKFGEATEQVESAMSGLNSNTKILNKLSWKVGKQGSLSESDSTTYKETVDAYMAGVKEYIEAKNYEFTTSAELILDLENDADGVGAKFIEDTNAMYAQLQTDLDSATQTVTEKVNIALEDGVITADEETIIQEAMAKVTEIKDKIAQAQSEAADLMIELKFGGGSLDETSYNQMIQEIQENTETKKIELNNGIEAQLTNLNVTYDKDSDEWKAGYDKIKSDFEAGLKDIELDASNLAFEITGDNFENVLGEDAVSKLQTALASSLNEGIDPIEWTDEQAASFLGVDSLTEGMGGAIGQALSNLDTAGFTVPEEISSAIGEKLATNVADSTNEFLTPALDAVEADVSGITATEDSLATLGTNMASSAQTSVQTKLNETGIKATSKLTIDVVETTISGLPSGVTVSGLKGTQNNTKKARGGIIYPSGMNIPGFSNGGTVRGGAQLITVAEEGTPEMIIPLGSQRRKRGLALWKQAGHMMGVPGFANGGIVGGSEDEGIRHQSSGGTTAPSASQGVQVNVGGVTVEVNVNGGEGTNISQAIAAQGQEIAETVAGILADAFNSQFENTPNRGIA